MTLKVWVCGYPVAHLQPCEMRFDTEKERKEHYAATGHQSVQTMLARREVEKAKGRRR